MSQEKQSPLSAFASTSEEAALGIARLVAQNPEEISRSNRRLLNTLYTSLALEILEKNAATLSSLLKETPR